MKLYCICFCNSKEITLSIPVFELIWLSQCLNYNKGLIKRHYNIYFNFEKKSIVLSIKRVIEVFKFVL